MAKRRPDPDHFLPLPHLAYHVLLALVEEPLHGWAVIKRIRETSPGNPVPSSGSLYLSLGRLEERGLVEESPERPPDADGRRRYFRLTGLGRRVLEAESLRLAALVEQARSLDVLPSPGSAGQ